MTSRTTKTKRVGDGIAALIITLMLSACGGRGGAPTTRILFLATGYFHTCAVLDTGRVKCWGSNGNGQLGLGDTANRGDGPNEMGNALPAVDLGTDRTITQLGAGQAHTCVLFDNGQVKCWGWNQLGGLGLGDTLPRGDGPGEMGGALPAVDLGTGRTAIQIAVGGLHTCALLDTDQVKCWGDGFFGQIGLGNPGDRGDGPFEMGDFLPVVDLGTGRRATRIAAGSFHTCALLDTGQIKCWGLNTVGTLGLGDASNRGDGFGEMGDALPAVDLGTGHTATRIAAGSFHTCALLDTSQVKCWGQNNAGQLGLGDASHRGDAPGEMGDALPTVNLGIGRSATQLAAGEFHTCALLDTGQVKCWGQNNVGQLGLGDTNFRGDGPGEMGDALPFVNLGAGRVVIQIAAGFNHTCALLDNGTAKCWGFNSDGELGLGDTNVRGDQPSEMGDALSAVDIGTP